MTSSAKTTAPRPSSTTTSRKRTTTPARSTRREASSVRAASAPAKKAPVKKIVAAKKVSAKKLAATKATVKKAPAKKIVAPKAPPKKAPAKKIVATKVPAKKIADVKPIAPAAKRPIPKPHLPTTKATPIRVSKLSPAKAKAAAKKAAAAALPTTTPLTSDQWNDKNRELFFELKRIADDIEKLEAVLPEDRDAKMRMRLRRLRMQHQDTMYRIFDANYGLLRRYVRKFSQNASSEDISDFESAATVGLMRAITTYDPERGRFAQWAFKPMQREVLRAVHSADHQNMNAGDFERRPDILRALRHLQDGDESARPSMETIAAQAGVTVEQTKRVLQAPHLNSIDTPVGDGTTTIGEMLTDDSDSLEDNVITRMGIKDLETYGLSELDPRELFVIIRRQGLDCEPKQRLNSIGATLGLSREAVRQIESRARGKLAHPVVLRKLARQGRD